MESYDFTSPRYNMAQILIHLVSKADKIKAKAVTYLMQVDIFFILPYLS